MKVLSIILLACMSMTYVYSQDLKEIKLNAPDKTRGSAFMKALAERKSAREYDARPLSLQDLSDLLWAANGVNREDGHRTAPSASNKQDIDIYAILPDGAYLYDAPSHVLKPIAKGDYRGLVAGSQDFVKTAAVCLVLVSDLAKHGDPAAEQSKITGALDAGIVNQNINVFCSAVGLTNVPRTTMDKDELRKVLKLTDAQLPMINNVLGYPKK
ncbi:MAG: SagB/ThcOx family dehydrogenase [Tannerella sp.]|jgi:SagB-type dehydrogenase family enzyme|nr:SagB/ThcOx family dehydrogenase [Tannerella sp.]